jgi:hypothetical protein
LYLPGRGNSGIIAAEAALTASARPAAKAL